MRFERRGGHAPVEREACGRTAPHRRRVWFLHAGLGVLCYLSLIFTYFMAWYFPGEHTFQ